MSRALEEHRSPPIWDPVVLARIRRLHLQATRVVDGLMHGVHRSRRVGSNIEFADYKEYSPGDALRDVDWRVFARSDRLVTRRYEVETELACTIVLDASGDVGTGQSSATRLPELEGSKLGHAITLAACLAWFLHKHQEPVGLVVLGGQGESPRIPARGGAGHVARIFGALASIRPGGRANLGPALAALGPLVRRRSLVAVLSDFMEEPAEWVPSLSALARRRTDIVGFHLMDRQEMALDFERPALFYSPEGGELLPVDPVGAAAEFRAVREAYFQEIRAGFATYQARYYPVWTHLPLELVLARMIGGLPAATDGVLP